MAGISEHIIEQIHDRTDIVEVIGGYIPLKKAGRNFKASCPFHHEKTASFMVSQDKQIFHCFGCGVGGNVFNFLMKYERLEFPEAVRQLAQKAGVLIPESSYDSRRDSSFSDSLYSANEFASAFFNNNLGSDKTGRSAYAYLVKRGLNAETIKMFKVGFATSGWDNLLNAAGQKGIKPDVLEKAGLAIRKDEGGYYDRFRNRIMFSIMDSKSRIIGFGGRVFLSDDSGPKYMNSPETTIYNKSRNLYGLNFTWKYIRDEDRVIIVEGYLDLILPFQYGIRNIVASLGTSLTQDHVRLLKRYAKSAVVIFDPDKAGELATLRSLDLLIEEGLNVGVVRLPEGFDPDSFVSKFGEAGFREYINEAKNLFDYKMSVLLSRYNKDLLEDKAKIVEEMLITISKVPNAVLKSGYIKNLADSLSVDVDAIVQELRKVKAGRPAKSADAVPETGPEQLTKNFRQSEKVLTGLMIDDNAYVKIVKGRLGIEDFQHPAIRRIVETLFCHCAVESKGITPGKLINYIDDEQVHKCIPELIDAIEAVVDKEKTLEDCITRIKKENLEAKRNRIQVEIVLAQDRSDDERINRLIAEYQNLVKCIKECEIKAQ